MTPEEAVQAARQVFRWTSDADTALSIVRTRRDAGDLTTDQVIDAMLVENNSLKCSGGYTLEELLAL